MLLDLHTCEVANWQYDDHHAKVVRYWKNGLMEVSCVWPFTCIFKSLAGAGQALVKLSI